MDNNANEPAREDSLAHEKRRADTWREYALFARTLLADAVLVVLLIALIFYGIPALDKWDDSSDKWAKVADEYAGYLHDAGPEIKAAAHNVNAATGGIAQAGANLQDGSESFKRLIAALADPKKGTPALQSELIALLAEYRTQGGLLLANGATLVKNSDSRLNGDDGLLASLNAVLKRFNDLATNANAVVDGLAKQMPAILNDLHELLGSPEWKEAKQQMVKLLQNSVSLTANADLTMARVAITADNIAKASAFIPGIAQLLQQIAKTNSRFQKAFLLARIFGLLAAGLGSLGY